MKKNGLLNRLRHMDRLDLVVNIIVFILAIINLFPFYYLLTSSVKTSAAIFKMPPDWWPKTFQISNYTDLFQGQPALRWPI